MEGNVAENQEAGYKNLGQGYRVMKKKLWRRCVKISCFTAAAALVLEGMAVLRDIASRDYGQPPQSVLTGTGVSASGDVEKILSGDAYYGDVHDENVHDGTAQGGEVQSGAVFDRDIQGETVYDKTAQSGDAQGGTVDDRDAQSENLYEGDVHNNDVYASDALDAAVWGGLNMEEYPEQLRRLLELNKEAAEFVFGYAERENYKGGPIDLSEDFVGGEVPLLMQWDRRWGYDPFGDSMIGIAGCGPVCMDMAYLYFTEDTDMTPREISEMAYEKGYYTEAGTSWSFWTEGAAELGLKGKELPLDENRMKSALDAGGLIVCSMRPGDFTTTGHYILIRGYDGEGFYVNDPNRRSNSEKVWSFDVLKGQIRNLWALTRNS